MLFLFLFPLTSRKITYRILMYNVVYLLNDSNMTQRTRRAASVNNSSAAAQSATVDANVVVDDNANNSVVDDNDIVDDGNDAAQESSIFDTFAANIPIEKSTDNIIKELLADKNCKRVNNLHVRNVVATAYETYTMLTFIIKEYVFGDIKDNNNLDAFGMPSVKIGRSHNVITSSYAVSAVMKNSAKSAIFAGEVADMTTILADGQESAAITGRANIVNNLYVGGTIDVIMQYVPANTDYINPFSASQEPTRFDADKVICHIVRLSFGEVGQDMYKARILG